MKNISNIQKSSLNPNDPDYLTLDLIDFDLHFPKTMKSIQNYYEYVNVENFGTKDCDLNEFSSQMQNNLLPMFNDEINTALGSDYWNTLLE